MENFICAVFEEEKQIPFRLKIIFLNVKLKPLTSVDHILNIILSVLLCSYVSVFWLSVSFYFAVINPLSASVALI